MTDSANYFIAWWSAVYSRLSYLNPQEFLGRYTEIFGDTKGTPNLGTVANESGGALPTTSVLSMMSAQAAAQGIPGLLDDKVMLSLQSAKPGDKRWGLNVVAVDALNASVKPTTLTLDCITNYGPDGKAADTFGEASAVASWAEKVNIILGERRKMKEDTKDPDMLNCAPALVLKDNPMLVFRAISDSNYGTTYVFGDRRAPNLVWVVFRGTANAKSALAYSRPSSLTPTALANFYGIIDAGLIGIFKILQEQIHVIIQMAVDVATELNPGVALAPGSIKLLTTGHSLGGAMATAFAGEYVQQISPDLSRIVGAEIFDVSIGCYSLASPRVFGPKEAAAFCCLTQASELCKTDTAAGGVVVPDSNVKGRISYLRVVTTLDLVTALPKVGYEHPCSEFTSERDMITMDCDIETNGFITNKAETRCLNLEHKRPSMTADFSKAPVCTDRRKKTWSISSILYHLTYCGIMFAGGVDINSALSLDVERLQPEDVTAAAVNPKELGIKEDNTMMRILWYGFNQSAIAKCVFFDLVPFRVKETMDPAAAAAAAAAPVTAAPVAAAAGPAITDVLSEDSKMTNAFIVSLKTAIMADKYNYPITDQTFKPPILYKPPTVKKGVPVAEPAKKSLFSMFGSKPAVATPAVTTPAVAAPPQDYNYLYQLPATIGTSGSRFTLFFGKAQGPPRKQDADGNFMLHPHEEIDMQAHLDLHNQLVSADANTAVAAIHAAQGTPQPVATPAAPAVATPAAQPAAAKTGFFGMFGSKPAVATPAAPAVATPAAQPAAAKTGFFGMFGSKPAASTPVQTPVKINMTPTQFAQIQAAKQGIQGRPSKGGRRTRRLHKLKSRKHKKGKKVARVSRRKHRSRTRRH